MKPGEPILVRDDHRRSLVIEVGTGESLVVPESETENKETLNF